MNISCPKCHFIISPDTITLSLCQKTCFSHNDVILEREYKYICPNCVYHQPWMTDPAIT